MTTKTMDEIPDLAPAGGTPFSKLFSFCMPKKKEQPEIVTSSSSKRISFAAEAKEIPVKRELEMEMEDDEDETTMKTVSEDQDEMEEIPDMDKDHSSSSTAVSSGKDADWMMEVWKMILSMFFLQWLQEAKSRQRLKNAPESEAPPSIS
mmetsp:Transcript_11058/g.30555  ORF Transcript_11058/g.30555 Transcript_11058/m.30555 type:complete len:149 (-) Transcript_11058:376-822(-)